MTAKTKYRVRETGIEEVFYDREFCVEVPNNVADVKAWLNLHRDEISQAADAAAVAWIMGDEPQGVPEETLDIIYDGDEPEDHHTLVQREETNIKVAEETV